MNYSSLMLLSGIGFLVSLLLVASNTVNGQSGFKEYKSEPVGIKLQIPSEWDLFQEYNSTEDCFELKELNCMVLWYNVNVMDYSNIKYTFVILKQSFVGSLKDFAIEQYNQLQNYFLLKEFSFIDDRETTIQGYPAWQIEYNQKHTFDKDNTRKNMEIYVKVNDTYYEISYNTLDQLDFDLYLPDIQNVLKTLEFIPDKPVKEKNRPSFMD